MMTLEEIKNVSFREVKIGGYRKGDVDDFTDRVIEMLESLAREGRATRQKLQDLTEKLDQYRAREESIGQVLLTAQHQADTVVREAERRAQEILQDAQAEAQQLVGNTRNEIDGQKEAILTLRHEVSQFKSKLLGLYREHLTLIDALPGEDEEKEKDGGDAQPAEEPAAAEAEKAAAEADEPKDEEPAGEAVDLEKVAQEILAEEAQPQQPEPPVRAQEAAPRRNAEVSLFDEDGGETAPPPQSRFSSLKFGEDYDLKDDPDVIYSRKKR